MTRQAILAASRPVLGFTLLLLNMTQMPAQSSEKTKKPQRPLVGDYAPDFELSSIDDKTTKFSSLTEQGPVVLVMLRGYPGYQCPICTKQVSGLLGNAQKFKDSRTNVVLIYPGPSSKLKKHAEEFVRGNSLPDNFYLLLDPDYRFTTAYELRWDAPGETAYPSTFVVGTDGRVQFAKVSKSHGDRASPTEVLKALENK